jgi:hypothetical protein
MKIRISLLAALLCLPVGRSLAQVASDAGNNLPYFADNSFIGQNGGSGFGPWEEDNALGGGAYIDNSRNIAGFQSFAIYSNNYFSDQYPGGYGLDRPLSTPLAQGSMSVLVRHDVDNSNGFSGINLKSVAGPLLNTGELLSIGMLPTSLYSGGGNNNIAVFGSTSQSLTPNGNPLNGDVLDYLINWDTDAGTFSVTIDDLSSGGSASTSGNLDFSGQPVAAIGFGNFNVGSFQNLIFDNLTVNAVPEPASATVLLGGAIAVLQRRGRSRPITK